MTGGERKTMPDREKVIKELESLRDICNAKSNTTIGKGKIAWAGYANTADAALALLKEQGAVVAHWDDDTGHWIEGDRNGIDPHTRTTGEMIDTFRCSWCGFYQYWKTPFCPNCGAKMEDR